VKFLNSIGTKLKPIFVEMGQFVYKEHKNIIDNIYFVNSGLLGYVLSSYKQRHYLDIKEGECFGVMDIVLKNLSLNNDFLKDIDVNMLFEQEKLEFQLVGNNKHVDNDGTVTRTEY
jgi:hypothetical protein